ncbi:unnamed protein product [Bemisia tabaci]|uniref:Borealin C-terminal domain-containing protein n=1 Tax=Bemisia tabaci TaxID=7038 RepID=A0A9P0A769_BEMTA|nr:unnamed protein product [Bemisia tabaci]
MVRTKKVSKGSRASTRSSTRKRSMVSRASTLSSGNITCDSDGFAVPGPAVKTLESMRKDIKEQFNQHLNELTMAHKLQKNNVMRTIARFKIKFAADLQKPICQLLANYQPPAPASATKIPTSAQKIVSVNSSVMQDRTNMPLLSKSIKAKTVKQTDKDVFKQPAGKTRNSLRIQQQTSTSKFVTPLNARPTPNMLPVTPKVNIDTPLSIIRRPRAGEFAMSITGSPLMVSAIPREEIPSVCVPLPDGNILSILPNQGLLAEDLPFLDEGLRAQLETLQSNLKVIIGDR